MKICTGKFRPVGKMGQDDWLACPLWEIKLRSDDNYWARPIHSPTRVTRELLGGRRIVVLARCEQFDRDALAEVRSVRQLGEVSVFWRGGMIAVDRLTAAKFPFCLGASPMCGLSETRNVPEWPGGFNKTRDLAALACSARCVARARRKRARRNERPFDSCYRVGIAGSETRSSASPLR